MKKRHVVLGVGLLACMLPVPGNCFVQADLDKLLSTNECVECDLSGANLAGRNLTKAKLDGVNLSGANLSNAIFRMADLAGAKLRDANLTYTSFEAADMFQADFNGATLEGTVFDGAYLVAAEFGGTREADAAVGQDEKIPAPTGAAEGGEQRSAAQHIPANSASDIAETVAVAPVPTPEPVIVAEPAAPIVKPVVSLPVQGVSLTAVPGGSVDPSRYAPDPALNITGFKPLAEEDESDADQEMVLPLSKNSLLDQVDDTQMCVSCDFTGMDLADVKLKGIYLEGGTFEGANLEGANLRSANLKKANLRNANLAGADLRRADLYKADLSGANLVGADLRDTLLSGADLTGAKLDNTVLSQETTVQ